MTVNINVVNNSVVETQQTVVLSAFATNFDSGSDSIVITEDDSLLLTTDVSQNTFTRQSKQCSDCPVSGFHPGWHIGTWSHSHLRFG